MVMAAATEIKPTLPLGGELTCRHVRVSRSNYRPWRGVFSSPVACNVIALKKSPSEGSSAPTTAEDSSISVIAAITSLYNEIVVVDTPDSRLLLLDSSR